MPSFDARIAIALLLSVVGSVPSPAVEIVSDPMRPDTLRSAPERAPIPLRVNAIIVSDERRIAIVNGRRVGVGDAIGDATVVAINKSEVILDVNGGRQSLHINGGAGK